MARLLIFDLYGTILRADKRDGVVRDGLLNLLDYYKPSKTAIFTDGYEDRVMADLEFSGLIGKFDAVYHARHCVPENYLRLREEFKKRILKIGGGTIKNLERVCNDFGIPKAESVFIGDNFYDRDEKSAEIFGLRFIKVPQFRANPPDWREKEKNECIVEYEEPSNPFSFKTLIGRI